MHPELISSTFGKEPTLAERLEEAENVAQFFIARRELESEGVQFEEADITNRMIQNGQDFRLWIENEGEDAFVQYAEKHASAEIESFDEMESFFIDFQMYKKRTKLN